MDETKSNPVDVADLNGPAQPISADDIVAPLGERMPSVTEGQTNAPLPPKETPKPSHPSGAVDQKGVVFDPSKHASENGRPKLNKDGRFYSNRLGKHGKSAPPKAAVGISAQAPLSGPEMESGVPSFATPNGPAEEKQIAADEFDLLAEMALQTAYGPVMVLFSEDARPNAEEHAALKQSYAAWFRQKGIKEVSPGWGCLLTTAAVCVKKTEKPSVRERVALWVMKIKTAFNKAKKTNP